MNLLIDNPPGISSHRLINIYAERRKYICEYICIYARTFSSIIQHIYVAETSTQVRKYKNVTSCRRIIHNSTPFYYFFFFFFYLYQLKLLFPIMAPIKLSSWKENVFMQYSSLYLFVFLTHDDSNKNRNVYMVFHFFFHLLADKV